MGYWPGSRARSRLGSRERLAAIMLMGCEVGLHIQASRVTEVPCWSGLFSSSTRPTRISRSFAMSSRPQAWASLRRIYDRFCADRRAALFKGDDLQERHRGAAASLQACPALKPTMWGLGRPRSNVDQLLGNSEFFFPLGCGGLVFVRPFLSCSTVEVTGEDNPDKKLKRHC
jgi:hypothetical protein